MMWGNDKFDPPSIGLTTLTIGISHHHQGYGHLDMIDFKKVNPNKIVSILRRDCLTTTGNVNADLVNLYHQLRLTDRRLIKVGASPQLEDLRRWINKQIEERLSKSAHEAGDFLWSDRITDICDRIAFLYCSGGTHEEEISVYQAKDKESAVPVKITVADSVMVQPWPFKISLLSRDVIGYHEASYPDSLVPAILGFSASSIIKFLVKV
jgi:hypothetical protein